jgi:hypothetical protein
MIDMPALLVEALNSDPEVFSTLTGGVYAYRIPPDAKTPLALVLVPGAFQGAAPTQSWWSFMATIDIHAENPADSMRIAELVTAMVPTVVGSHSQGVVADGQVSTITAITDGGWTPTRYRQIVTVDLTARRTFEGG